MNNPGAVVEIQDYVVESGKAGQGLRQCSLAVEPGQVVYLESGDPADGMLLLRSLASLERPQAGSYYFKGRKRRIYDYRDLLECKRRVGYIAQDAVLISNLSVRENLMLMKWYFGNSFDQQLDSEQQELCRLLGLERKIDMRPADLDPVDVQFAIVVRELSKKPLIILMDRPEDLVADKRFDSLGRVLEKLVADKVPLVFTMCENDFFCRLANRRLILANGCLFDDPV